MEDSPLGPGKFWTSDQLFDKLGGYQTIGPRSSDYVESEGRPTFPLSKLPHFTLIGLGDQLKLFTIPMRQTKPKSPTLISSPTSPRLKYMLKECLNIQKWAENSTKWWPPDHVPWESLKCDVARTWIPEGSILSPEEFSLALVKYKDRYLDSQLLSFVWSAINRDPTTTRDSSQDIAKTDIFDMMLELSSLKLYFEDFSAAKKSSDTNISDKLPLPSLLVSDSHFTFPIPLESSSTLSGGKPSILSRRRRRKPPPALVTTQNGTLLDVPYPGIPPAFLGLSLASSPENTSHPTLEDRPTLHFEEMITNLRLQCSTMELKIPPADVA